MGETLAMQPGCGCGTGRHGIPGQGSQHSKGAVSITDEETEAPSGDLPPLHLLSGLLSQNRHGDRPTPWPEAGQGAGAAKGLAALSSSRSQLYHKTSVAWEGRPFKILQTKGRHPAKVCYSGSLSALGPHAPLLQTLGPRGSAL